MKVYSDSYYHLYNRGNNKELIFFEDDNYNYFLSQFKKYVSPYCETYSYCLMPNHFHFFIRINEEALFEKGIKNFFIHKNPVVAGLVDNMEDYRYSSYSAYLSEMGTSLSKREVLEWFGGLDGFIEHHKADLNEAELNKLLKL